MSIATILPIRHRIAAEFRIHEYQPGARVQIIPPTMQGVGIVRQIGQNDALHRNPGDASLYPYTVEMLNTADPKAGKLTNVVAVFGIEQLRSLVFVSFGTGLRDSLSVGDPVLIYPSLIGTIENVVYDTRQHSSLEDAMERPIIVTFKTSSDDKTSWSRSFSPSTVRIIKENSTCPTPR